MGHSSINPRNSHQSESRSGRTYCVYSPFPYECLLFNYKSLRFSFCLGVIITRITQSSGRSGLLCLRLCSRVTIPFVFLLRLAQHTPPKVF